MAKPGKATISSVSPWWRVAVLIALVVGFSILIGVSVSAYRDAPQIPARVVGPDGAGIFGFLINMPIVSYYEVGTMLTPNRGHAALMGIFGTPGLALLTFALRQVLKDRQSASKAYLPTSDFSQRTKYHPVKLFRYDSEKDQFVCPQGQLLPFHTRRVSEQVILYRADAKIVMPVR